MIKPLNNNFKANGFNYELIKRVENIALVRVLTKNGQELGFEIHKVRVLPVSKFFTQKNEDVSCFTHYEAYASNEQFGQFGWSYQTSEYLIKDYPQFAGFFK